ncbi:hypothetical protein V1478_003603 [Vespula squamosa]|uniref:Uncharacterized protein n=1 Tax=Vespula squamosa TaxID=30214 RepID=A0ABD2BMM9_VESSQ
MGELRLCVRAHEYYPSKTLLTSENLRKTSLCLKRGRESLINTSAQIECIVLKHKTPRELDSASKSFKPDNRQSAIFNEHKDITASKQGCVQSYLVPLKDIPGSSERGPAFPERPTSNDQFPAVPISEHLQKESPLEGTCQKPPANYTHNHKL